jgi:hypothetical protein
LAGIPTGSNVIRFTTRPDRHSTRLPAASKTLPVSVTRFVAGLTLMFRGAQPSRAIRLRFPYSSYVYVSVVEDAPARSILIFAVSSRPSVSYRKCCVPIAVMFPAASYTYVPLFHVPLALSAAIVNASRSSREGLNKSPWRCCGKRSSGRYFSNAG